MTIFYSIDNNFNPDFPYCNVIGPTGGFSNYVSWLIFLDPKFGLTSIVDDFDTSRFKQTDWPDHIKELAKTLPDVKNMLSKDINQVIKIDLDIIDLDSKLKFLENYIFPPTRSWNNWFVYEWIYRIPLQSIINVDQSYYIKDGISNSKNILLTIDPTLAYKCYLKFNSFLSNQSKEEFLKDVNLHNDFHKSVDQDNALVLDSGILFNPELDRDWYLKLINWLDLTDNYPHACLLHKLWFDAHKRAEHDIVETFINLYRT